MSEDFEEQSVDNRLRLESILSAYEAFTSSVAYPHYVRMRQLEAENIAENIITIDPIDRASEIEALKLRGDLRTTIEFKSLFEEVISSLKDDVEKLLEAEKPTDAVNNQNEVV